MVGWSFTGVLSIGRGSTGESFNGNIDYLFEASVPQDAAAQLTFNGRQVA
ncbi:hypothetical protein [Lentzea indica]|nr:hypothetical protein [Lentzea indica]